MNNDIKCDNKWAFENDSSNHAKEGMGVPEMMQALKNNPTVCPYSLPSGGNKMKTDQTKRQKSFKSKFVRCLAIYRRLQRAQLSVDRLAGDYEVSSRTILRDINALTLAGYPILPMAEKGVYKGE